MSDIRGRTAQRVWPLLLLCLLLSTRWLLLSTWPGAISTLWTQTVAALVSALLFTLHRWLTKQRAARTVCQSPWLVSVGFGLALGGAAAAQAVFGRRISASSLSLALALTPTVVAVISSAGGEGSTDLLDLLWPSLCGLTGLLLLLPQPGYTEWRSWAALALAPLLTGLGAALARGLALAPKQAGRGSYPVAVLGAMILFAVLALVQGQQRKPGVSIVATMFDTLTISLSLLALSRTGALGWSSQFLLTPLLAFLQGYALLHPAPSVRLIFGICLSLLGAVRLLATAPNQSSGQHGIGLRPGSASL